VNTKGYWDPLIQLLNHVVAKDFAEETLLGYVTVVADSTEALNVLREALG